MYCKEICNKIKEICVNNCDRILMEIRYKLNQYYLSYHNNKQGTTIQDIVYVGVNDFPYRITSYLSCVNFIGYTKFQKDKSFTKDETDEYITFIEDGIKVIYDTLHDYLVDSIDNSFTKKDDIYYDIDLMILNMQSKNHSILNWASINYTNPFVLLLRDKYDKFFNDESFKNISKLFYKGGFSSDNKTDGYILCKPYGANRDGEGSIRVAYNGIIDQNILIKNNNDNVLQGTYTIEEYPVFMICNLFKDLYIKVTTYSDKSKKDINDELLMDVTTNRIITKISEHEFVIRSFLLEGNSKSESFENNNCSFNKSYIMYESSKNEDDLLTRIIYTTGSELLKMYKNNKNLLYNSEFHNNSNIYYSYITNNVINIMIADMLLRFNNSGNDYRSKCKAAVKEFYELCAQTNEQLRKILNNSLLIHKIKSDRNICSEIDLFDPYSYTYISSASYNFSSNFSSKYGPLFKSLGYDEKDNLFTIIVPTMISFDCDQFSNGDITSSSMLFAYTLEYDKHSNRFQLNKNLTSINYKPFGNFIINGVSIDGNSIATFNKIDNTIMIYNFLKKLSDIIETHIIRYIIYVFNHNNIYDSLSNQKNQRNCIVNFIQNYIGAIIGNDMDETIGDCLVGREDRKSLENIASELVYYYPNLEIQVRTLTSKDR